MKHDIMVLRHSAAHLLAHAVMELYPGTLPTIGPATATGFFYDFLPSKNFTQKDLPLIEERMHEIAKKNHPIVGGQVPKAQAAELYKNNQFKLELIEGIEGDTVGIYHQGDFFDLCKGGHITSLGEIKYFKLTGISGSYWRADRNGIALQRISGVVFFTQQEMDDYFKDLEEAKKSDHRHLGQQLDLFTFHDEAPGSVFFHDKGVKLFNTLVAYSRYMQQDDYQEIRTPILNNESLYKISGHYDNYHHHAYVTAVEDTNYWIRPMNCPSCVLLFAQRPRSYRELPLRISEYGLCHRFELSGVLHGLFRVRSFTQDDAHIFCSLEQMAQEAIKVLQLAITMYNKFGFEKIKWAVSTRPEKYIGDERAWEIATKTLKDALETLDCNYIVQEGEGAFYGPKIEIKIEDRMGREWQCGTLQVDFNMPQRFDLSYIQADQQRAQPVMLHRAIYGSIERFLGILIEHYKGHFPFFLAPVQCMVLTITDDQKTYAHDIARLLEKRAKIRVKVNTSSDPISGQIKDAQLMGIPWMLVLGKKEVANNTITIRYLDGKQEFNIDHETLIERALKANEF
jgi:threonyl-tRNA synthetase